MQMFYVCLTEGEVSALVGGEGTVQRSRVKVSGVNTKEGISPVKRRGEDFVDSKVPFCF